MADLTITPPPDSNVDMDLKVTATATQGGSTAQTTEHDLHVDVIGVADAPNLATEDSTGDENQGIPLDISTNLTDTDGSESLSITIGNIPDGATLNKGTLNADGTYTLTPAQLFGLEVTPATDFEGTFTLFVTSTSTENDGDQANTFDVLNVNVEGGADTPVLIIGDSSGLEDSAIALNIDAQLTDLSETLSVTISGVPDGAALSNGTIIDTDPVTGETTWNVMPAHLNTLSITPPEDSNVDFNLTVTAASTNGNGDIAETEGTVYVAVQSVADEPELETENATGTGGEAIDLEITSALTDLDGSESLSLTISGVPQGASLSAGVYTGNGTWALEPGDLNGLTISTPENYDTDFDLTVTATATDSEPVGEVPYTDTASVTATIHVDMEDAQADPPVLVVDDAEGLEDNAIPLDITASLTDPEETLSMTISGVPQGASLSLGTDQGEGVWSFTEADLANIENLTITPPLHSDVDFDLTVTATSQDGDDTATVSDTLTVVVGAVADTPAVSADDGSGDVGQTIPLDISSALVDQDGSESLSITISDVPAGASLSAGTDNQDETWTLELADLTGLNINLPADASDDFDLTVTATATEADGGDTASNVVTSVINVDPNANDDVNEADMGGFTSGNVITGLGDIVDPNAAADTGSTTGNTITEVTFGDTTVSFSDPSAVQTDENGNFVTIEGDFGTLKMYEDGDYGYVADPSQAGESGSVGLTDPASPDEVEAAWSGIETFAFDFGTSYLDNNGQLDPNLADDTVSFNQNGIGVEGTQGGMPVPGQINHDENTGQSEALGVADEPPLTAELGDGSYEPGDPQVLTVEVTNVGNASAGYNNTYGYYIKGENGEPVEGGIVWSNVKTTVGDSETITLEGVDPASVGFFLIPDGYDHNPGMTDGMPVTFQQDDAGIWTPVAPDGTLMAGQGAPAFFSDEALNPDDYDHMVDNDVIGNQNWEDLFGGGDNDYNDANFNATMETSGGTPGNTTFPLDIATSLVDADGSETLSVTVAGLPEGVTLSAGTLNDDGSYTLLPEQLDGLTATPPADSNVDFDLTISATSIEQSSGDTNTVTQTMTVDVIGVADEPTLDVALGDPTTSGGNPQPVAYWNMNESSDQGTLADSVGGHTAETHCGLDMDDAGVFGTTAAEFNGSNDYISVPHSDDIKPDSGAITVWFNADTVSGRGTLVSSDSSGFDTGGHFGLFVENGHLRLRMQGTDDQTNITGGDVSTGEWNQVTVTWGDDGAQVYLNGEQVASDSSWTRGLEGNDNPWTFGTNQWVSGDDVANNLRDYFNGHMDDIAIFDTQLSADDVSSLYSAGVTEIMAGGEGGDLVYPLDITSNLTDTDGSETLSLTVNGLPEGATLSAGTVNDDGSVTLSPDELQGLELTVPGGSTDGFDLTVSSTATENDGDTATVSQTVTAGALDGTAETPELDVDNATGAEDTAIALNIDAALTDTDGSETLSVTISGVPTGAQLSAGTDNQDGTWTLESGDLNGLTITPPANSNEDIALSVTATSTESSTGDTATATANLTVDVIGVADQPQVVVQDEQGNEDTWIQLHLDSGPSVDTDGSETLSITISDVPQGARLNPGADNGDGTWTVTAAQLPLVCILPPDDFSGDITMTLNVTTTENDGDTTTVSDDFTVSVIGVADGPSVTATQAQGYEDSAIALNIGASLTDDDNSETLSVTISGIPQGATLSAGTVNNDGSVTLTPQQLDGLTITPPEHSNEDFPLTVSATSTETATGDTATTTATFNVGVTGVADTPSLSVTGRPADAGERRCGQRVHRQWQL